jgi:transcriptional regulator with XRE-family HTH domain
LAAAAQTVEAWNNVAMSTEVVSRDFAKRVNEARLARHLSVRAVARLAGVPATTAQGWLSGAHLPSVALRPNYVKLVAHLGLLNQLPDELIDELGRGVKSCRADGTVSTMQPAARRTH